MEEWARELALECGPRFRLTFSTPTSELRAPHSSHSEALPTLAAGSAQASNSGPLPVTLSLSDEARSGQPLRLLLEPSRNAPHAAQSLSARAFTAASVLVTPALVEMVLGAPSCSIARALVPRLKSTAGNSRSNRLDGVVQSSMGVRKHSRVPARKPSTRKQDDLALESLTAAVVELSLSAFCGDPAPTPINR